MNVYVGVVICYVKFYMLMYSVYAQFIVLVNLGYRRQLNTRRGWAPRRLVN